MWEKLLLMRLSLIFYFKCNFNLSLYIVNFIIYIKYQFCIILLSFIKLDVKNSICSLNIKLIKEITWPLVSSGY